MACSIRVLNPSMILATAKDPGAPTPTLFPQALTHLDPGILLRILLWHRAHRRQCAGTILPGLLRPGTHSCRRPSWRLWPPQRRLPPLWSALFFSSLPLQDIATFYLEEEVSHAFVSFSLLTDPQFRCAVRPRSLRTSPSVTL